MLKLNAKKFLDRILETESVLKDDIKLLEFNVVNLTDHILIQFSNDFCFALDNNQNLYFKSDLSCDLSIRDLEKVKVIMITLRFLYNKNNQDLFEGQENT